MRPPAPSHPRFCTKRQIIRLAEQKDVPEVVRYVHDNREFLQSWEPGRNPEYFTEDYWKRTLARNWSDFIDDQSLRMHLFAGETDSRVIGTLNFSNFVRGAAQYCTMGYSLAEEEQGKGYMSEAIPPALKYVFEELNMHRVIACYMPHNVRSAALLKRLGFVVEGFARDYLLIDVRWEDHVITGIVNPTWASESK